MKESIPKVSSHQESLNSKFYIENYKALNIIFKRRKCYNEINHQGQTVKGINYWVKKLLWAWLSEDYELRGSKLQKLNYVLDKLKC